MKKNPLILIKVEGGCVTDVFFDGKADYVVIDADMTEEYIPADMSRMQADTGATEELEQWITDEKAKREE